MAFFCRSRTPATAGIRVATNARNKTCWYSKSQPTPSGALSRPSLGRWGLLSEVSMTSQQIDRLQRAAYRAGVIAAWDVNAKIEIPIRYSSHLAASAYVDGFTAEREVMARVKAKKLSAPVKLTLLAARESDKFTKAADCA